MHPDLYTDRTVTGPQLFFRSMEALTGLLVFLKATGLAAISAPWWVVTAPFWVPLTLAVIIMTLATRPRVLTCSEPYKAMPVAKTAPKQAVRAGIPGEISGKKYNAKGSRSWSASPKMARKTLTAPSPAQAAVAQQLGGWTYFRPDEIASATPRPEKVDNNKVLAWFAGTTAPSHMDQKIEALFQDMAVRSAKIDRQIETALQDLAALEARVTVKRNC